MHGGRGLAFWYTKEPMGDGPIFGARDRWDGLSVWLDSANPKVSAGYSIVNPPRRTRSVNKSVAMQTHTPTVMAILNDGSLALATSTDPSNYVIGSCSINYRNTGIVPAHLRVNYKANILTVRPITTDVQGHAIYWNIKVMLDVNGDGQDFRTCLQKTGITLPSGYYFGVSVSVSP